LQTQPHTTKQNKYVIIFNICVYHKDIIQARRTSQTVINIIINNKNKSHIKTL